MWMESGKRLGTYSGISNGYFAKGDRSVPPCSAAESEDDEAAGEGDESGEGLGEGEEGEGFVCFC